MKNNLKALMLVVALGFSATAIAGESQAIVEEDEVTGGQPSYLEIAIEAAKALGLPVAIVIGAFIVGNRCSNIASALRANHTPAAPLSDDQKVRRYLVNEAEISLHAAGVPSDAKLEVVVDLVISARADVAFKKDKTTEAKGAKFDADADGARARAAVDAAVKAENAANDRVAKLEAVLRDKENLLGFNISKEMREILAAQQFVKLNKALVIEDKISTEAQDQAKGLVRDLCGAKEELAKAKHSGDLTSSDATKRRGAEKAVSEAEAKVAEAVKAVSVYKV